MRGRRSETDGQLPALSSCRMQATLRTVFTLGVVVVCAAGCDGCNKEKPYTPFGVASATEHPESPPDAAPPEPDAEVKPPAFTTRSATVAPAGAERFVVGGRELKAPDGRVFERALAADFDQDGQNEVVAWTIPKLHALTTSPGELWLYPSGGATRKLLALPGFVPTGPACKHTPVLTQTGLRSVTLDVAAACTTTLLGRAPTRSISVVAPLSERPLVLTLRVAEGTQTEPFALTLDSTDRDGDGRDDVRLSVTQLPVCTSTTGAGCTPDKTTKDATATVVWLDRAAGISRDATEPARSLGLLAAAELNRSKRRGADVVRGVAQVRRLMGTLCAEGATARVFEAEGSMLKCGPLAVIVERLLVAEVQSALANKEPRRALAALERDGWYFGRVPDKRRAELEKSALAGVTRIDPKETRTPLALPPRSVAPRWSPLGFEAPGALLAQTTQGVVRIGDNGVPTPVDPEAGVSSWPLEITTASGQRPTHVVTPCDRSDVYLRLVGGDGGELPSPTSGLLAPRPGACAGSNGPSLVVVPLGEKNGSLALSVSGENLGSELTRADISLRPRVWGSPSSPDGRRSVVPTSLGLWVDGGDKPELWRTSGGPLTDCTVSDGANAVACVGAGAVRLFRR